jgi:surfeit locus 1 family protein
VKLHPVLLGAIALAVLAVCLTAGFWQLSRLRTKQALNAARRAALAAPPEPLEANARGLAALAGRKVVAFGEYDSTFHVLLSARFHDAVLGVELLTPLRLPDGGALLVDRGWMRAEDGQNADPGTVAEPGPRRVVGLLVPIERRAGMPPWRRLEGDAPERWSAHELDSASVAAHVPATLAHVLLVALPATPAPDGLAREGPPELDEQVHVSYAIQWFSFAAVTLVGSLVLALRARRARAAGTSA